MPEVSRGADNDGKLHWAHHSIFLVAEVDGEPAAALCGYFEDDNGSAALARAFPEVSARCGRTPEQDAAAGRAILPIMQVAPEHAAGVWIVENVATLPRFRRQGLVDRLLVEALERGRTRGAKAADIGVLIGNDAAQRAYEKVGFRMVSEKRNGEFEAIWGCPGIRGLHREI